jgi:hypothetical protein
MRKGKDPEPDPYFRITDPELGGPKHADPADPDPQHWLWGWSQIIRKQKMRVVLKY